MSTDTKKTFRIPLVWQEYGHVDVEADSVEEAIAHALGPECPLPDGSYVDESVEVDYAVLEESPQPMPAQSDDSDESNDDLLWNALLKHRGHTVGIASYGDPDAPANVSLECEDCDEIVLDAEIYTICARKNMRSSARDVKLSTDRCKYCDAVYHGTKHWRNKRTGRCTFSWYSAMQWATDGDDVEAWLPDGLSEVIKGDHAAPDENEF